jgi:hypothetical protein
MHHANISEGLRRLGWVCVVVALLALAGWPCVASAAPMMLQEVFGGNIRSQPFDAEKQFWDWGADDDYCWLASASNVLAWGGWYGKPWWTVGGGWEYDKDHIFQVFKDLGPVWGARPPTTRGGC